MLAMLQLCTKLQLTRISNYIMSISFVVALLFLSDKYCISFCCGCNTCELVSVFRWQLEDFRMSRYVKISYFVAVECVFADFLAILISI